MTYNSAQPPKPDILSLSVNTHNFSSLSFPGEKLENSKKPTVSAKFVYALAHLSLVEIKAVIEKEAEDSQSNLIKKLSKHYYGSTALHFSLLNPDIEVARYIFNQFKTLGINLKNYDSVENFRKTAAQNDFLLFPKEKLFNVALGLASKEKMKFLISEQLTDFVCPELPEDYWRYSPKSHQKYVPSTLLEYALHLSKRKNTDFPVQSEKIAFYLNFAFSYTPFKDFLETEKNNFSTIFKGSSYKAVLLGKMLLVPSLYSEPLFQQFFVPAALSSDRNTYSRIVQDLGVESIDYKNTLLDIVLKNYETHIIPSSCAHLKAFKEALFSMVKNTSINEYSIQPYLTRVDILTEKISITNTLTPLHTSSTEISKKNFKI